MSITCQRDVCSTFYELNQRMRMSLEQKKVMMEQKRAELELLSAEVEAATQTARILTSATKVFLNTWPKYGPLGKVKSTGEVDGGKRSAMWNMTAPSGALKKPKVDLEDLEPTQVLTETDNTRPASANRNKPQPDELPSAPAVTKRASQNYDSPNEERVKIVKIRKTPQISPEMRIDVEDRGCMPAVVMVTEDLLNIDSLPTSPAFNLDGLPPPPPPVKGDDTPETSEKWEEGDILEAEMCARNDYFNTLHRVKVLTFDEESGEYHCQLLAWPDAYSDWSKEQLHQPRDPEPDHHYKKGDPVHFLWKRRSVRKEKVDGKFSSKGVWVKGTITCAPDHKGNAQVKHYNWDDGTDHAYKVVNKCDLRPATPGCGMRKNADAE